MFHFAGFNLFGAPSELGRLDLMGDRVDIHTDEYCCGVANNSTTYALNTTNGAIVLAYYLREGTVI